MTMYKNTFFTRRTTTIIVTVIIIMTISFIIIIISMKKNVKAQSYLLLDSYECISCSKITKFDHLVPFYGSYWL